MSISGFTTVLKHTFFFAEEFEETYLEVEKIGEGGAGTVYSGYRIEDLFPVSIFIG